MKDIEAFKALGHPHRDFAFSAEMDQKAYPMLDIKTLEDLLNQKIKLKNYGSVRQIIFVLIAIKNHDRHQSIAYNIDAASVDIYIEINYKHIEQATSKEDIAPVLARYFLSAIPLFSEIPVFHFSISEFYQDVKKLFEHQKWSTTRLPILSIPPVYPVWASEFRKPALEDNPAEFFARKFTRYEWFDLINIDNFVGMLNQRFHLSMYGPGVTTLYLSFIADELEPATPEYSSTYFREDQELHLTIPIQGPPFDQSCLLEGMVGALPEVKRWDIMDFDWERLWGDLQETLMQA